MKEQLKYKDYYGTIEASVEDGVLHGKVIGIQGLISYEGKTLKELEEDFKGAVDDYLALCKEYDLVPQKSYKGNFNVRVTPNLHAKVVEYATEHEQTVNSVVSEALAEYLKEK